MIDATAIARKVEDCVRWCREHRWSVLAGVLTVVFARQWLVPGSIDARHILGEVSRELQATYVRHDRLEDGGKEIALVVNTARKVAGREPLSYSYDDPLTEIAIGQCMAVFVPSQWRNEKPPDNCKIFVRRSFTLRESMIDALAPWIGENETLAIILDPGWKKVGGCVMEDGGTLAICLIVAK